MGDLLEINKKCKCSLENLEEYELIEKIVFSDDETKKVGSLLKDCFKIAFSWDVVYEIKESISVFLVACAKYYYNDGEGGFWKSVENLTGIKEINKRNILIKAFNSVLDLYDLNKFEKYSSEGYKNIAPIVAHSGLPNNLLDNLLSNIKTLCGQDISYNDLGDEAMFALRYATKNVNRYVETLENTGLLNDFIQEVINVLETKQIYNDERLVVSPDMNQNILNWAEKNLIENDKNYKTFKQPKLRLDINSNRIIIEFPEFTQTNSDRCSWEIFDGQNTKNKKVYGEKYNDTYHFRATEIICDSFHEIEIKLVNDIGEVIRNFDLKNKSDYFSFNNKGQFNKTNYLLNNGAYILIDDKWTPVDDLEPIENIGRFTLYYQEPSDSKQKINFLGENNQILEIKIKRFFDLEACSRLIGENCKFEKYEAFDVLPQIRVPFNGVWQLSIQVNEQRENKMVQVDDFSIDLGSIMLEKVYGEISIRIYNKDYGYKTFKFLYLPSVGLSFSHYFPNLNGYENMILKFKSQTSCEILDENHEFKKEFRVPKEKDVFRGFYKYNDKEYGFSLIVKPFSWSLESSNNLLGQSNKKNFISVKDLTKEGDAFLSITNNTEDEVFFVFDNNVEKKIVTIKKSSKRIVNLVEYIEFITSADGNCLLYLEQDNKKICDLCDIRINISIRNLTVTNFQDNFIFEWDEDGICKNRELKFRYVLKPWEFFSIPIIDRAKMAYIETSDPRLKENCIVEVTSKEEKNIFGITRKEDLPDGQNLILLDFVDDNFTDVEFSIEKTEDFKNAILSYLVYKISLSEKKDFQTFLLKIKAYIQKARFVFGDEFLLQTIFKYDISKEIFNLIVQDLCLYFPILSKNNEFRQSDYCELAENNKYLYYTYTFIRRDDDQLNKILPNLTKFFDDYKAEPSFINSKKYYIFPGVDDLEYFSKNLRKIKNLKGFSGKREEEILLSILVNAIVNRDFEDDINLVAKLSEYTQILYDNYPGKLMSEIFIQTAKRREK